MTAKQNKPHKTNSPLRWWWISLCLSAILWLGTKPLEQMSLQFQALEEFENPNPQTPSSPNLYQTCRYAAAALGTLSLIGFSWQISRQIRSKSRSQSVN